MRVGVGAPSLASEIQLALFSRPTRQWRSINDIEADVRLRIARQGQEEVRRSLKILVIDDEPFVAAGNLRNHGYNIDHLTDVSSVSSVAEYGIILCDLQGVGSNLDSELQGAHLIREIKRTFPNKYVIAYSGAPKNRTMSRVAQESADEYLKKDAPIQDWVDVLDGAIALVSNPIARWRQFRTRMLEDGMTPIQLAELEDAFVASFWEGQSSIESNVSAKASTLGLGRDLRAVVQSFVASLIFNLVFQV